MLRAMSFAPRLDAPRLLQYAALLAALGGVATWSSLLLTPAESQTPAVAPQVLAARSDNPACSGLPTSRPRCRSRCPGSWPGPVAQWRSCI